MRSGFGPGRKRGGRFYYRSGWDCPLVMGRISPKGTSPNLIRAWNPLQIPSISQSRLFRDSITSSEIAGFRKTAVINFADPSGSSPPLNPPGSMMIWLCLIFFCQLSMDSFSSCSVRLRSTNISSSPAFRKALSESTSQLVPGNTGASGSGACPLSNGRRKPASEIGFHRGFVRLVFVVLGTEGIWVPGSFPSEKPLPQTDGPVHIRNLQGSRAGGFPNSVNQVVPHSFFQIRRFWQLKDQSTIIRTGQRPFPQSIPDSRFTGLLIRRPIRLPPPYSSGKSNASQFDGGSRQQFSLSIPFGDQVHIILVLLQVQDTPDFTGPGHPI